jgi:hypothetical protein
VVIDRPRILVPNRALDFGPGFYCTSSLAQARRWAQAVARRHHSLRPVVHAYDFDSGRQDGLRVKRFPAPTVEWLEFIAAQRLSAYRGPTFDLIIGPVANDRTIPVVQQYLQADDKAAFAPLAIALIKPENLADQHVFATCEALERLTLREVSDATG